MAFTHAEVINQITAEQPQMHDAIKSIIQGEEILYQLVQFHLPEARFHRSVPLLKEDAGYPVYTMSVVTTLQQYYKFWQHDNCLALVITEQVAELCKLCTCGETI